MDFPIRRDFIPTAPTAPWKHRRSFAFRYSLRSLLLLTLACCLLAFAFGRNEARKRERWDNARQLLNTDQHLACEPPSTWLNRVDERTLCKEHAQQAQSLFLPAFHVRVIDLSCCTVSSQMMGNVEQLSEVRALNLGQCSISNELIPHLGRLTNLERLNLRGAQVTNRGLVSIGQLENLRELSLANTQVSDDGLKNLCGLKRLQSLDLEGTCISDAGIKYLARLKSLAEVRLYRTRVTAAAVAELDACLPCCERHNPLVLGKPIQWPVASTSPSHSAHSSRWMQQMSLFLITPVREE